MNARLVPVLLIAGAVLGPHGLSIITQPVLSFLDPAAPAALVVLGIAAALRLQSVGNEQPYESAAAGALQAAVAGFVVTIAFLAAPPLASTGEPLANWTLAAIILGIAAATSVEIEDCIVPIVAGGLLLAFTRETGTRDALLIAFEGVAIAVLIAASGWLLLSRTSPTDGHRVSTFASALLLGGAADYLSLSALLFGLVAGGCWGFATSTVREHISRDISYVAHSVLALVLIMAGAYATFSAPLLAIAIAYTVLRACGKLGGHWLAVRTFSADRVPAAQRLMLPGAFGVAFALNVVRALGSEFSPVLTVVVLGTIASSLLAALIAREADT
jgi:hypothetical protein